ncbi:MAG: hypothetical protein Q9159_003677 [Coniocarpon cinnabarinum]
MKELLGRVTNEQSSGTEVNFFYNPAAKSSSTELTTRTPATIQRAFIIAPLSWIKFSRRLKTRCHAAVGLKMGKTNRKTPQGPKAADGAGNSNRRQRTSGPPPREVQISKKFSFLLRHGAEKQGLTLGVGGYVNLADLLAVQMVKSAHVTLEEVKHVVATNEKKRYGLAHIADVDPQKSQSSSGQHEDKTELDEISTTNQALSTTEAAVANPDADPSHYLIRANQGHSIKLTDSADLLIPITREAGNLPEVVVHGTRHEAWPKILETGGLKPMTRNHVHFATGIPRGLRRSNQLSPDPGMVEPTMTSTVAALSVQEPTTPAIISGMRNTSNILIFLDVQKALDKGLLLFQSANGVVLTEGDDNGVVPVDLFERVEEKSGQVLVERGVVISGLKGYAASETKSKKNTRPKLNTKDPSSLVDDHGRDSA